MRVTDGTRYAVIGSKGGDSTHPEWYLNLLADPEVTHQDGDGVGRYRGHVAEGHERADWWARRSGSGPTSTTTRRAPTASSRSSCSSRLSDGRHRGRAAR
jgi:deazaflavin-dependent oxidoreductase (nitroreductase family)